MNPTAVEASPAPARRLIPTLIGHAWLQFVHAATQFAWLFPVLARNEFNAGDWQTVLLTAVVPMFMVGSVFWNELMQRVSLRTYLTAYWAVAILPYVGVAIAPSYGMLLACQVLGSLGFAGWVPLNGRLLRTFYPDSARGRFYSVLSAVGLIAGMAAAYGVGEWLARDAAAYRIFLPIGVGLHLTGMLTIYFVARDLAVPVRRGRRSRRTWGDVVAPVARMGAILRRDPAFLRYEAAFMTYGAGFMICDALLPLIVTDKLNLPYDAYSQSSVFMRNLAMLALTMPWGYVHDRIGAVRLASVAFALLATYPLLLLSAGDSTGLAVASLAYGVSLSAVGLTWMLGPVALAPRPELAPSYAAIHATLVGLRGVVFQFLGMGVYSITGSFVVPLLLASAALVWGAWQMWQLHRFVRRGKMPTTTEQPAPVAVPGPTAQADP